MKLQTAINGDRRRLSHVHASPPLRPFAPSRLCVNHNAAAAVVREKAGLYGRVQNVHLYCLALQLRIAPAPLNGRCGGGTAPAKVREGNEYACLRERGGG